MDKYPYGRMAENMQRLQELDVFHCLLAGNVDRANAVQQRVADLPEDFIKWLQVCDGGMLFDTTMLTTKSLDTELDLDFDTYSVYYDADLRAGLTISDDWFIFAIAVHSDLFFFDLGKKNGQVHQWDVEEQYIYKTWPTFEDWLTYQIDEAVELIADDEIRPLGVKLEVDGDE